MSMTETLFLTYLFTGITVGFGHCIGMCGPIVVSLSLGLSGRSPWIPHLLYNAGRVLTYALLGGVLGATGSFTRVTSDIAGIQKAVLVFAAILIVIMGIATGGWFSRGFLSKTVRGSESWISRGFGRLSRIKRTFSYLPLGLLLGLLPCGPVYTALIGAARAGMETQQPFSGAISGAGMMAAFGFGTVAPLLLVARLSSMEWLRSRVWVYRAGSILMIGVGVYFLVKALRY